MTLPTLRNTAFNRDALFLVFSSVFITALVMGNLIGTTKFIHLFSSVFPTCFCPCSQPDQGRQPLLHDSSGRIDSISRNFPGYRPCLGAFGRAKAQLLVWVGFGTNCFMLLIMTINFYLPNAYGISGGLHLFDGVYNYMVGNTIASMIAYLTAQTIDVSLFHFWKEKTKGRHLWLRNNASTMVSQLVDSTAIMSILYFSGNLGDSVIGISSLVILIINAYAFKFLQPLSTLQLFI
jgi:queuosine precursor transporter